MEERVCRVLSTTANRLLYNTLCYAKLLYNLSFIPMATVTLLASSHFSLLKPSFLHSSTETGHLTSSIRPTISLALSDLPSHWLHQTYHLTSSIRPAISLALLRPAISSALSDLPFLLVIVTDVFVFHLILGLQLPLSQVDPSLSQEI